MATFTVEKSASLKRPWRVMARTYSNGKADTKTVPRVAYAELGFVETMTIDEARARAKQLNAQGAVERKHQASVTRIARRVQDDELSHTAFVPADLNEKFLEYLDDNISGKEASRLKARYRWKLVKDMIIALQMRPEDYFDKKKVIYRYLASKFYSLDYVKRIIRILNLYGRFMCKLRGQYFEKVPMAKGTDREMINDAYLDSESYFGPSEELTPEILTATKDKFILEQWNWLFCTMWLGLRPSELDMILEGRNESRWYITEQDGVDVLWVYQSKLTSIARDKRWKPIPLYYPEQQDAYGICLAGRADKPLIKTLQKHITKQQYGYFTLYGGRKGFTDLMLSRGQGIEDIAQWLGHSSIEMTWSKYKSRTKLRIVKLSQG